MGTSCHSMTLLDEIYLIAISYKVGVILLICIVQTKHLQPKDNKNNLPL